MNSMTNYPDDFQKCATFHGHVCPGLAIGYAAVKASSGLLSPSGSEDEELVCIVENNSCSVDAVQALLGCTFGKGNLIFRDWGKQVFTFYDREKGKAVRASFRQPSSETETVHDLRKKIETGTATDEDKRRMQELRDEFTSALISEPTKFFDVKEIAMEPPAYAQIVETSPCAICREQTMISRMVKKGDSAICKGCAQ
ncbi:MAG: FmdE family protein [Deltaproteobacteria bacterium]|nr:FmdE family protein [Deltaproteobacteria bacterium]